MSERLDNHAAAGSTVDGTAPRPKLALSDRVRSLRMPEPSQARRSGGGSWLPWILCLLLAGTAGYVGYLYYTANEQLQKDRETAEAATQTTQSSSKARDIGPGEVTLENKGYIIPVHQIQVSPKVSGQILRLHFKEGDVVEKGTLLAEFEDVDYRAARDRAQAALLEAKRNLDVLTKYRQQEIEQAKAKLDEAKAQLVQLESDYQRSLRLRRTGTLADLDFERRIALTFARKRRGRQLETDNELLRKDRRATTIQ